MNSARIEWHDINLGRGVIVSVLILLSCILIPFWALTFLDILPMISLAFVALGFLVGIIVGVYLIDRTYPSVIGLAIDKIILRYRKRETREISWLEISQCVCLERRKTQNKIVTNEGEFLPLRISEELADRILYFWNRGKAGSYASVSGNSKAQ